MSEDQDRRGAPANGDQPPPRSWLTPYLLMLLRSWHGYGYELVRQLALFGYGWVDPATVYRALRELERDGYVMSRWDTSAAAGPARRVYTITDTGIEALGLWATTLDSYRQLLERFFQQYGDSGQSATADAPARAPATAKAAPRDAATT